MFNNKEYTKPILIKDRPYRVKLTSNDRRLLKKRYGQKGYEAFLYLNKSGLLYFMDPNEPYDAIKHIWVDKFCLQYKEKYDF